MKKRIVCLLLGLVLTISQVVTVLATTEDELRQQKSQAESQLSETNAVIDDLSARQSEIQEEISSMDAEMVDLMIQIDAAKSDIEATEGQITETKENITSKEAEIEQTKKDLKEAEDTRDKQYEDMKKRIQYIYENGGESAWFQMLFDSEDFSKVLTRADYVQDLQDYDRAQLEAYVQVVKEVKELKASLENQKKELEEQKAALEEQKASLESQKADLEIQQSDLQDQIDAKKAASADYEDQIATARQQAEEISNLIAEQEAELNRLAEERRRAEEEAARRAAAEEAARQAAAEEAARQQAAEEARAEEAAQEEASDDAEYTENDSDSGSSDEEYYEESYEEESYEEESYEEESSDDSYYEESYEEEDTSYSGGGSSGSSIVAYADQFVGNPYVWGGNSLTNGIDCSHFVYQVLKNCGVYSGGYTTSSGWRSLGSPVGSLSEAQAGDVICYSGHVAIYDGYGGIVEAKGSAWGITHDRSADCKTILAIRRFT